MAERDCFEQTDVDAWFAELDAIPVLCERCGHNLRGAGSRDVASLCGYCGLTVCASCGLIWAADGPCHADHGDCGMLGHRTVAEQPKHRVAVKS